MEYEVGQRVLTWESITQGQPRWVRATVVTSSPSGGYDLQVSIGHRGPIWRYHHEVAPLSEGATPNQVTALLRILNANW